jgi:hypothetical protein
LKTKHFLFNKVRLNQVFISSITVSTFEQGKEIDLIVGTDVRDGNGSTRMVNWCGCTVQSSYPALRGLGFLPAEGHGVYVVRSVSCSFKY